MGTLFNMVGFQTKLKYQEQTRTFRMIPGLENANLLGWEEYTGILLSTHQNYWIGDYVLRKSLELGLLVR